MFNIMAGSFWPPSNIASHNFEHVRLDTVGSGLPMTTRTSPTRSILWPVAFDETPIQRLPARMLNTSTNSHYLYWISLATKLSLTCSKNLPGIIYENLKPKTLLYVLINFFSSPRKAFEHIRIPHSHFRVSCLSKWRWIQHVEMIFKWNDLKMILNEMIWKWFLNEMIWKWFLNLFTQNWF